MGTSISGKCVACEGPLELFGPRLDYEYHICRTCGSLQLFPQPTEEFLSRAYAEEYAGAGQTVEIDDPEINDRASHGYRNDVVQAMRAHHTGGPVLELGAGWGELCRMLIGQGIDCAGFEPNKKMADHCARVGLPVRCGSIADLDHLDRPVSSVAMCCVFEHIVNHGACLDRIQRVLQPGGHFITMHPTAACYALVGRMARLGDRQRQLPELRGAFAPPWHTAFFSVQGMRVLAERHGFEVVEVRPGSQGRAPGAVKFVQMGLETVNRLGWLLFGTRWPLVTSHTFVLRKPGRTATRRGVAA